MLVANNKIICTFVHVVSFLFESFPSAQICLTSELHSETDKDGTEMFLSQS